MAAFSFELWAPVHKAVMDNSDASSRTGDCGGMRQPMRVRVLACFQHAGVAVHALTDLV